MQTEIATYALAPMGTYLGHYGISGILWSYILCPSL